MHVIRRTTRLLRLVGAALQAAFWVDRAWLLWQRHAGFHAVSAA
jgi:hypothetical protein